MEIENVVVSAGSLKQGDEIPDLVFATGAAATHTCIPNLANSLTRSSVRLGLRRSRILHIPIPQLLARKMGLSVWKSDSQERIGTGSKKPVQILFAL